MTDLTYQLETVWSLKAIRFIFRGRNPEKDSVPYTSLFIRMPWNTCFGIHSTIIPAKKVVVLDTLGSFSTESADISREIWWSTIVKGEGSEIEAVDKMTPSNYGISSFTSGHLHFTAMAGF